MQRDEANKNKGPKRCQAAAGAQPPCMYVGPRLGMICPRILHSATPGPARVLVGGRVGGWWSWQAPSSRGVGGRVVSTRASSSGGAKGAEIMGIIRNRAAGCGARAGPGIRFLKLACAGSTARQTKRWSGLAAWWLRARQAMGWAESLHSPPAPGRSGCGLHGAERRVRRVCVVVAGPRYAPCAPCRRWNQPPHQLHL